MKKIWTKALPHVVAMLIFAAIAALFFAPQYQGKSLSQGDVVQHSGMGRDIKDHVKQYGEHPQWSGNAFSGMPAYQIDMNYDGRYVKMVTDNVYFLGQPAAFLFVAMAGFYLMLLMFGVNPWVAIIGGVGYGLSSYFPIILHAGHITKMMAMCWVAPLIGAIYYTYRRHLWLGALLAGVFASIEISTSHPQISYYFLFAIVGLIVWQFVVALRGGWLRRFWLASAALLGAAVLAVGSNVVQLYYVASYTAVSTRGASELVDGGSADGSADGSVKDDNKTSGLDKDYATAWSYGIGETLNLFIPNFAGGASRGGFSDDGVVASSLEKYNAKRLATQLPGYWGDQPFTEGPVYLGAVMVFLFVLGLFVVRGGMRWWIVGVSVLSLMLAWGHNLMWFSSWFLDYFPMYNKFRSVSMILVLVQWAVPLLGVVALDRVICVFAVGSGSNSSSSPSSSSSSSCVDKCGTEVFGGVLSREAVVRGINLALYIVGGVALLSAVVLPSVLDFSSAGDRFIGVPDDVVAAMQVERASLLRVDALRSLALVVVAWGLLTAYCRGWIRRVALLGIIGVCVCVDLYNVDRRYLRVEDFKPVRAALGISMSPESAEILKDTTNYRVANFSLDPFKDATTSYYHRSVGGYHAAKMRRYQDLIDRHLSRNNMAVYDMLNTKYFITKEGLIENPNAAGNAWFVPSVRWVDGASAELAALDSGFNARQVAVVDERFESSFGAAISAASSAGSSVAAADSGAQIELVSYRVNELVYRYRAAQAGVAVFSEIYYPQGWSVYVDGEPASYFRADYVLRAMVLPAGEHTVEWRFAAPNFQLVVWITRLCSLVLLLGVVGIIVFYGVKKLRKDEK